MQLELCFFRKELVAENPALIEDEVLCKIFCVVVLENATHLNVGHGEGFRQVLQSPSLHDRLIECLSGEIDNAAIWPDGTGMDVDDLPLILEERNFNITVL